MVVSLDELLRQARIVSRPRLSCALSRSSHVVLRLLRGEQVGCTAAAQRYHLVGIDVAAAESPNNWRTKRAPRGPASNRPPG